MGRYSTANFDIPKNFFSPGLPLKEKGAPLKQTSILGVGERVKISSSNGEGKVIGTVIVPDTATRYSRWSGCCVVLMDEPESGLYRNTAGDFLKKIHWHVSAKDQVRALGINDVERLSDQTSAGMWWGRVPQILGVRVSNGITYDGVEFPSNGVGRIVRRDTNRVLVHWINFNNSRFRDRCDEVKGATRCYWVPLQYLELCVFSTENYQIFESFGAFGGSREMPVYKIRDLLVMKYDRPMLKRGNPNVMDGSIMRVVEDLGGPAIKIQVVGNCSKDQEGMISLIDKRYVAPFPFPFLTHGTSVMVNKDVQFRKRNLRGMTGKVKLYTDLDGDVGVEFEEDIDAGSLDGEGRDGHCLYLSVSALDYPKAPESASE